MSGLKVYFDIKLTKSQQEIYNLAHDPKYKFITLVLSRQQGKTTSMMILVMEWLLEKDKKIGYVCRNNVFVRTMYDELVKIFPSNLIKRQNGTSFVIESIFGTKLQIFSAESGASLRGQSFHYLICDEFPFFKMEQTDGTHLWNDILSPTVKVKGRKCIFVGTPLGKDNIFYTMYKRGLDEKFDDYASILKTIYDDGLITKEEIERTKRDIPEVSFKQEYLCIFLDNNDLVFFQGYGNQFKKYPYKYEKTWIGVDLSGDGTDETIVTKINERDEVEQIVVKGTLDMKYQQVASIINNSTNLQMAYIEVNGLGAPMFNEIKKLVKNKALLKEWVTTNSSKEQIITNLALRIAQNRISFNEADNGLRDQFGTFICRYTKSRKVQFEALAGHHDDRIMALALALQAKLDYDYKWTRNFVSVVKI